MTAIGTRIVTLHDLAERFSQLMRVPDLGSKEHPDGPMAKGFTIGKRGRRLYWYITPSKFGNYRVVPLNPDGSLGAFAYYPGKIKVKIHYNDLQSTEA